MDGRSKSRITNEITDFKEDDKEEFLITSNFKPLKDISSDNKLRYERGERHGNIYKQSESDGNNMYSV